MKSVFGKHVLVSIRLRLIEFCEACLQVDRSQVDVTQAIDSLNRDMLEMLATCFDLELATGAALPDEFIVVSNHLGMGKALKISPSMVPGLTGDLFLNDEPFMPLWAGVQAGVARVSGRNSLMPVQVRYPGLGGDIQSAYGAVVLPGPGGRVNFLASRFEWEKSRGRPFCFGFMPEGGTTGKRRVIRAQRPLDPFKSGAFVLSQMFNVPILPVVQSISRGRGHVVTVLTPAYPGDSVSAFRETLLDVYHRMSVVLTREPLT